MIGVATVALVTAVWQGVLLAALVWVGLRMLPKTPAAVRFAIWFGVFLVVTAMPLASLWPHRANAMQAGGRGAWWTLDLRWSLAIAAVWAVASLVRAGKLLVAAVRVRGLWKRGVPVEVLYPTLDGGIVKDGAPGLLRGARLCVSDEVDRPTVIGFFAPKILIPGWLLEKLTPAELDQIVLHEASHLGRADDWMNLLQKIALVIFPLNPALAWVEQRLCFERELAVDERVLRASAGKAGAEIAYASCLATVAQHRLGRRGLTLALGALGRESELGRRVRRILDRGERMQPAHARLVLGGALMTLFVVGLGLERCPQVVGFAQKPGTVTAAQGTVASLEPGYHAVMLRSNAVPAQQFRSIGDGAAVETKPIKLPPKEKKICNARKSSAKSSSDLELTDPEVAMTERATAQQEQVAQWVVVTAWQGADGSRLVMTTETTQNPAARASRIVSDMAPPPGQDSEQVHPYAAVPVRGGWLFFQL